MKTMFLCESLVHVESITFTMPLLSYNFMFCVYKEKSGIATAIINASFMKWPLINVCVHTLQTYVLK